MRKGRDEKGKEEEEEEREIKDKEEFALSRLKSPFLSALRFDCRNPKSAITGGHLAPAQNSKRRVVEWTRSFQHASPLDGRDSLFVLLENHLKNDLESPLIFVLF